MIFSWYFYQSCLVPLTFLCEIKLSSRSYNFFSSRYAVSKSNKHSKSVENVILSSTERSFAHYGAKLRVSVKMKNAFSNKPEFFKSATRDIFPRSHRFTVTRNDEAGNIAQWLCINHSVRVSSPQSHHRHRLAWILTIINLPSYSPTSRHRWLLSGTEYYPRFPRTNRASYISSSFSFRFTIRRIQAERAGHSFVPEFVLLLSPLTDFFVC